MALRQEAAAKAERARHQAQIEIAEVAMKQKHLERKTRREAENLRRVAAESARQEAEAREVNL